MFQGRLKCVLCASQESFKGVSNKCKEYFNKFFKGVSKLQGCFKEVSRVFQKSLKCVLKKIKTVSRKFQGV